MVKSMIVEPARAPIPTANSSSAFGPSPEKSTMHPSGTAPRIGRTTLPVINFITAGTSLIDVIFKLIIEFPGIFFLSAYSCC